MGKKIKVKITKEILEKVRKIPPGASGCQSDVGLIQFGIKAFFIIKIAFTAVVKKKLSIKLILNFIKALRAKLKVNHWFTYWGSGKHITVDALPQGVRKSNLLDKIKKGSKIRIFYNKNVTVVGLQMSKAYSYGTVGRNYGYPDFIAFVTRLVREVFPGVPDIKPSPIMDHCTENVSTVDDIALTQRLESLSDMLCPGINRAEVHPQVRLNYVQSNEGKANGWEKIVDFNINS